MKYSKSSPLRKRLIEENVGLRPQVLEFGHADGVGHVGRPPRLHPKKMWDSNHFFRKNGTHIFHIRTPSPAPLEDAPCSRRRRTVPTEQNPFYTEGYPQPHLAGPPLPSNLTTTAKNLLPHPSLLPHQTLFSPHFFCSRYCALCSSAHCSFRSRWRCPWKNYSRTISTRGLSSLYSPRRALRRHLGINVCFLLVHNLFLSVCFLLHNLPKDIEHSADLRKIAPPPTYLVTQTYPPRLIIPRHPD